MAIETLAQVSPEQQKSSRILRNVGFLASGQVVTWSLTMLWIAFVPRAIGAEGMGRLVIGQSVPAMLGLVASLGMATLIVKETAREPNRAPGLMTDVLIVRLALLVPGFVAITFYVHITHFDAQQQLLLYLGTASTFVILLTEAIQAAFKGIQRMEYVAYSDVLSKAVGTLAAIALVFLRFGVVALMISSLAIAVFAFVLNVGWIRKRFALDLKIAPRRISRRVVESLPYWVGALLMTVYFWVDSTILSLMAPAHVVGWYGVATQIFASLLFGVTILSTAWFPRFSAAFMQSQPMFRSIARSALIFTLMLSLPVATITALAARPFVAVIFGPQFANAVPPLVILALCLPLTYLNTMSYQVLAAANAQVVWTKVMVLTTILNPLINIGLIRYFQNGMQNGAIGAALSLAATELIMSIFAVAFLPWIWDRRSVFRLVRGLAAVLVMAGSVAAVASLGLTAQVVAGAATLVALTILLRLATADEVVFIRRGLAGAQRRLLPVSRRSA